MANTIYGSTLDSLSQNAIAQQQVDDARANAYRQYLLGVGGLGQRGREIESMDRYRQGEIGVRQQDVGGMNEFRRGQVGIGMTEAGTRAKDVESLGQYRRGELEARMKGIDAQRELGMRGYDVQREIGLGDIGVRRDVGMRGLGVQERLGLGQIGLGREQTKNVRDVGMRGLDVQEGLGLGQIGLAYEAEKNRLALGERGLGIQEKLGLGQINLGQGQLQLQRDISTNLTPLQRELATQAGGVGAAINLFPAAFGAGTPTEISALRESARIDQANRDREEENAYADALAKAYIDQTQGWLGGAMTKNSAFTDAIDNEISRLGMPDDEASARLVARQLLRQRQISGPSQLGQAAQLPPRPPMLPDPRGMTPPEPMDVLTNRTGPAPLSRFWTQSPRRRQAPTQ